MLGLLQLACGIAWIGLGVHGDSLIVALPSLIPGVLCIAAGTSFGLRVADLRSSALGAAGAFTGVLLALPAAWFLGFGSALLLFGLSVMAWLAAARASLVLTPPLDDTPITLALVAKVAVDELVLGHLLLSLRPPSGAAALRVASETRAALDLATERGWLEKPESYHAEPLALDAPQVRDRSVAGVDFEHFYFESEYEPHIGEPGRDRWLAHTANRTAHAWVLRHRDDGVQRPWLVCVHGYRLGWPLADFRLFSPGRLHHKLGFNLWIGVLPLHGPRRVGRQSGDGFLDGDLVDLVHAEAQAMWDLRRGISWIQSQQPAGIGAYGASLGGYTSALLTGLADGLHTSVAAIPVSDFASTFWKFGSQQQLADLERAGLGYEHAAKLLKLVSPLAVAPKLPRGRLALVAARADRIVPPAQSAALQAHWQPERAHWYHGAHVSIATERGVARFVDETFRSTGLVASD